MYASAYMSFGVRLIENLLVTEYILYTTLIIFFGLMCFFSVSVYITYKNNINIAKDTAIETTQICAGLYTENTDASLFVKAGSETRITIISSDGTILADSWPLSVTELENHLNRPEIQAAITDSPAAYIRHSDTIGVDLIYYALKVERGNRHVFIRTAIPIKKIDSYLYRSLPMLVLLLIIVAAICFAFTSNIVNKIVTPFNFIEQKLRLLINGEYKSEPYTKSYEEIDKIIKGIDDISNILQENFDDLRNEKSKLSYILNNIGDGLFVIDKNKCIMLINSAALSIFNVTPDITDKNLNYLSFDKLLAEAIEDCIDFSKNTIFELSQSGSIFLVTVKSLPNTNLTIVVLSDVTENRENAKRREEFFANASHELKTPLTAIKGFNELTALNNKDKNIDKYISGITRETERMLSLIADMLKLSELENTNKLNPIEVSLAKIVNEVYETVFTSISEKSLIFKMAGDGIVTAEPEHAYELIRNLVENAIRYSNHEGVVSVTVKNEKKSIRLIITDNGIGISPNEQTRIFERFYRVEKSRSGRNGGTGLGLSIVKHICALYDWKLSLKSKVSVGTEIMVVFDVK